LLIEREQVNIKKAHREDLLIEREQVNIKKAHREDRSPALAGLLICKGRND